MLNKRVLDVLSAVLSDMDRLYYTSGVEALFSATPNILGVTSDIAQDNNVPHIAECWRWSTHNNRRPRHSADTNAAGRSRYVFSFDFTNWLPAYSDAPRGREFVLAGRVVNNNPAYMPCPLLPAVSLFSNTAQTSPSSVYFESVSDLWLSVAVAWHQNRDTVFAWLWRSDLLDPLS